MKLKSLIAFAGVACAAASYGDATTVSTANTLCRIKFTTTEQEVLIGLPLVDVGGTTQTINATNYISTVGLPGGTTLFGKDSATGKWSSWEISQNAWAKLTIVADDSKYVPGDNASFARGSAVRLKFNDNLESHDVYLYGQVANASTTGTEATTASRDSVKATYTLLSNINASQVEIGNLDITGIAKGDKIALLSSTGTGMKEYYYDGSKWMEDAYITETATIMGEEVTSVRKTTSEASKRFQPGEGFFYITAPGNGDATFTW